MMLDVSEKKGGGIRQYVYFAKQMYLLFFDATQKNCVNKNIDTFLTEQATLKNVQYLHKRE